MKNHRIATTLATALALAAFSTASTRAEASGARLPTAPGAALAPPRATTPPPGPLAPVPLAAAAQPAVAKVQWNDIKDITHEMRAEFFTGLKGLAATVDEQIRELTARRAAMKDTTDTREWDFAMKAMESARSYLISVSAEMGTASRETWDQDKDKVGRAWVSTQEAYGKVKSSTTS